MWENRTLADATAKNWKVRAILRTRGLLTPMGALLLAILKINRRAAPRWGDAGTLHPDGTITSVFTPHTGAPRPAVVCTKDELQIFLYGLVTECKLTDEEGVELYKLAQNWVSVDFTPADSRETYTKAVEARRKLGK
jgi:hypothetical protein